MLTVRQTVSPLPLVHPPAGSQSPFAERIAETARTLYDRTRVFATYQIMRHTLEMLNENPEALRKVVREADAETTRRGRSYDANAKFALSVRTTDETTPITFEGVAYRRELSEISGDLWVKYDNTKPIDIETTWRKTTEPDKTVAPPLAYIIPPEWSEAIEVTVLHGLTTRRLTAPATIEVESYRFVDTSFTDRSFEGRHAPRFTTEPITERRQYPAWGR